jgi:hypothetical protein
MEDELRTLLMEGFEHRFERNLKSAKESGALSGEEDPTLLLMVVLFITARECFRPLSNNGIALLSNLEHFI